MILFPLDISQCDRSELLRIANQKERIKQALEELVMQMKAGHNRYLTAAVCSINSYADFLTSLNMSEADYQTALRYKLDRPTVFLKRRPCEILINNYDPIALCLWRASMDIQYVVNGFAAASYATTYMTKTDKSTSSMMEATLSRMAQDPDVKLPEMVRAVGNAFVNAQEVSAQEACYLTLGLPLKVATRQCIFVNTYDKDNRCIRLRRCEGAGTGFDGCDCSVNPRALYQTPSWLGKSMPG